MSELARRLRSLAQRSFATALLGSFATAQTTIYVDVNATPPGDGSQATPFVSIQTALDVLLQSSGTVLVAPGRTAWFGPIVLVR